MRKVPTQFSEGSDRHNAQKAWLDGFDAAVAAAPVIVLECRDIVTRLIANPEIARSSDSARMCAFCRYLWAYGMDELQHADDCVYLAACRLLLRP